MQRALALLLVVACGVSDPPAGPGLAGGPVPPPAPRSGRATVSMALVPGPNPTPDGLLTVTLPDGASGTLVYGLADGAYEISISAPSTAVFTATADQALVTQSQATYGYWYVVYGTTRDATTISASVSGDAYYKLVALSSLHDLSGTFTLQQTEFDASGSALLRFLGDDGRYAWYVPEGSITASAPACTLLDPATQAMPASVAETREWTNLEWGINGLWHADCGGVRRILSTNFDSLGITNIGCARSSSGTVSLGSVHQTYTIDCGANGSVVATWAFDTASP
jgi:hypothetical protein